MEAKMKTIAAGPDVNVGPGAIVSGELAKAVVEGGFADEVEASREPASDPAPAPVAAPLETATLAPPETAVMPQPAPRRPGASKKRKG
jgi:hypothetical protein